MSKKIIITLDGYSSTGKSTIAKKIAQELNYIYVDSGAMYRAITLSAINNKLIGTDFFKSEELIQKLNEIDISFNYNNKTNSSEVFLNNENVENQIRTLNVSKHVSKVATISEVRKKLVIEQQRIGSNKGIVMDGRDIGTVVFPNAELKFFLTASPEKRATRRYKELIDRGENVTFNEVLQNVQERDLIDSTRKDSPLKKAADAIEIDNSDMGLDEQLERILSLVYNKLERII